MFKKFDVPWLLLGTLILLFGVSVSLIEVTATEAAIQGATFLTYKPSLEILAQPIQLITDTLPMGNVLSVTVAWGVELAFMVCALGYEIAHRSIRHRNAALASWFEAGVWVCIAIDYGTNVIYGGNIAPEIGLIWSFLLRLIVAGLVCGFAMLFPVVGWSLIVESFGGSAHPVAGPSGRPLPAQMHQGGPPVVK